MIHPEFVLIVWVVRNHGVCLSRSRQVAGNINTPNNLLEKSMSRWLGCLSQGHPGFVFIC